MKDNNISNELLLLSLTNYYKTNNNNLKKILPIIGKSSDISLRLIDWFVTNYCKKFNIVFLKQKYPEDYPEYFNVYANYRAQLKAFKKIQFDPFRRRERIFFYYKEKQFIETTIGQLNFFRWFVDNGLLEYVQQNISYIENDMLVNQKEQQPANSPQQQAPCDKKHRLPFSKSMIKQMTKYSGTTTISFG
jgi:hypothetical protein